MSEQRLALGIDLGGTSIKVGVVNHNGEIVGRGEHPTEATRGSSGVVSNMAKAARAAVEAAGLTMADVEGAGIGAPGICNAKDGVVATAVNLGWQDVPVVALLRDELGVPVFLDNDANCAALGEQWCGAARGSDHMVMFTIGTGVGGGLILNGRIYHGVTGWAGEPGHMPMVEDGPQCNCGQRGCLETVASATAMAGFARQLIEAGEAPLIAKLAEEQGKVDARVVITAARQGDEPALSILRKVGGYLGTAAASMVSVLNPDLIVFGGGGAYAGELLLEPIRETVREKAMPGPAEVAKIVAAQLGNDAGLIGAASLVWR